MKGSRRHLRQRSPHHIMGESTRETTKSGVSTYRSSNFSGPQDPAFNLIPIQVEVIYVSLFLTVHWQSSQMCRRYEGRNWHGNPKKSIQERGPQLGCPRALEGLTVQVTMPDALDIFGVDEVVASLPYNVYRGQIHIITNPTKRRTQAGNQKQGKYTNSSMT